MARFTVFFLLSVCLVGMSSGHLFSKARQYLSKKYDTTPEIDFSDLLVKFSSGNDTNSFMQMPRTAEEAKKQGYVQPPETINHAFLMTFCEDNDGRYCVLFDKMGSVAGFQIGVPTAVDDLKMRGIDFLDKGFTKQTMFGRDFYINQMLFVPQDVLKNGGRPFNGQTGTGLWLKIHQDYVEIPKKNDEKELQKLGFRKQNCFMRMGDHYFYGLWEGATEETYLPWFILYHPITGDLIGYGFVMFGRNAENPADVEGKRDVFELVGAPVIRMIAPDSSPFVFKCIDDFGLWSMHIYLTKNPKAIQCPAKSQPTGAKY